MKAFWDQVEKTSHWKGKVGYGCFNRSAKAQLVVKHTCDNKLCVNPAHLELGTYSENLKEAYERGQRPSIRLSEEQVKGSPRRPGDLAQEFNISPQRVRSIKRGVVLLKELDADQIRADQGTLRELSIKYGVSKQLMTKLREGVHKTVTPVTPELVEALDTLLTFNGHPNYQAISKRVGKNRKWVKGVLQSS